MKFSLVLPALAALLLASCCSYPEPAPSSSTPLAGGYAPAKISPEIQAAAEYAVKTQSKKESTPIKLVSISKAEQQVVAGMNYHLILKTTQGGSKRNAEVKVFRSLDSSYQLVSWTWLK